MDSQKIDALIVKLAPARVDQLIASSESNDFNFTRKKFKEWVLTPCGREDTYEGLIRKTLESAKTK